MKRTTSVAVIGVFQHACIHYSYRTLLQNLILSLRTGSVKKNILIIVKAFITDTLERVYSSNLKW